MLEKKVFVQGMNSDSEDRLIKEGEFRYALNIRAGISDNGDQGVIENTKGNEEIVTTLPSGTNTCIGSFEDKLYKVVYYFIHNSGFTHTIQEYNYETNSVREVMNGGVLNFSIKHLITGVNLVDGFLLYWTDNFNEPRSINVTKDYSALVGGVTEQAISNIKYVHPYPPEVNYRSDTTLITSVNTPRHVNNLINDLWQFRIQYSYIDNEQSAWSPISKCPIPIGEADIVAGLSYDVTRNNVIDINYNTGNELVAKINIAARRGNTGQFFLIKSINKESLSISNNNVDTYSFYNDEVYSAIDLNDSRKLYDAVPRLAKAQELVDGNRIAYGNVLEGFDLIDTDMSTKIQYLGSGPDVEYPVTVSFGTHNYSYSEYRNANTGEKDQYNITTTEGLASVYSELFPEDYRTSIGLQGVFYGNKTNDNVIFNSSGASSANDPMWIKIQLTKRPELNDEIVIQIVIAKKNSSTFSGNNVVTSSDTKFKSYQYIVTATDVATGNASDQITRIYTNISNQINNSVDFQGTIPDHDNDTIFKTKVITTSRGEIYLLGLVSVVSTDLDPISPLPYISNPLNYILFTDRCGAEHRGENFNNVTRTFKSGANHKVGVVYSDEAGRLSTIMGITEFSVPFLAQVPDYLTPSIYGAGPVAIQLFMNHQPPEWAHYWHLVYSKNTTVSRYLQFVIDDVVQDPTNPNNLLLSLSKLIEYQNKYEATNGVVSYGWSKGDRIRLVRYADDTFVREYVDVELLDYNADNNLVVPDSFSGVAPQKNMLIEIYSPKRRADDEEQLYYEIGETHPVYYPETPERVHWLKDGQSTGNSPQFTPSDSLLITLKDEGDTYWRRRNLGLIDPLNPSDTYDTFVEDQGFSDFYVSNNHNYGRPNVFQPDAQETRRSTTIYYSNPYIPDTNINGLSSFYLESFEEYDQSYGSIQKLYSEDKRLICFQELKVGQILVNEIVYNDLQGGISVGASQNVLSTMIYYNGEYGISTNPESFAVYGNRKYFIDRNRGAVLRLSTDGITPISENGMRNYFNDKMESLMLITTGTQITGVYDKKFDEYVVNINGSLDVAFLIDDNGHNVIDTTKPGLLGVAVKSMNDLSEVLIPGAIVSVQQQYWLGAMSTVRDLRIIEVVGDYLYFDIEYPSYSFLWSYGGTVSTSETLAFSEPMKKWTSFFSFNPEMMNEAGLNIVSFKEGKIYRHNSANVPYNNFYGVQYDSKIEVISNQHPSNIKFYKTIQQESTTPWEMPVGKNQYGQKTNLIKDDFETLEGHHYAAFWFDENTPNVAEPLIEGDLMRSYTMSLLLTNDSTELEKLFSVGINFEASELSNR